MLKTGNKINPYFFKLDVFPDFTLPKSVYGIIPIVIGEKGYGYFTMIDQTNNNLGEVNRLGSVYKNVHY